MQDFRLPRAADPPAEKPIQLTEIKQKEPILNLTPDILIRNENIISKEHKTKSRHYSYLACGFSYKSLCWVDNPIIEVMAPSIPYKMIIVYD